VSVGAVRTAGALAFGALVVGAVVAPAVVFDASTARGGASRQAGLDLLVVSAAVGLPYAAFLQDRLRAASGAGEGATDTWLSAVHGLVVLSLAASGLPAAALHASARLHSRVVDAEWPVLLAWAVLLGTAVLLGEGTRRLSLRWLRSPQRL
jgi:hypothetical protein